MKWKNCLIDLHLHLDGSLSLASARALAKLQGIQIPESDEELLTLLSVEEDCRDLNVYLQKFAFPGMLLQTETALTAAVSTLLAELKEQYGYRLMIDGAPTYYRMKVVVAEDQRHIVIGISNVAAQMAQERRMEEAGSHEVAFASIAQALAADYFSIY